MKAYRTWQNDQRSDSTVVISLNQSISRRKLMLERVMGIEPTSSAWEAEVLPLNNTRSAKKRIIIRSQNPGEQSNQPVI